VAAAQRRAGLAAAGPVRRSPVGWLSPRAARETGLHLSGGLPAAGRRGRRGIYPG